MAKEEDDTFNVLTEMSAVAEETEERRRSKKVMTEEEKKEQRRINRESREKKKEKKDINKKRKKGELAVEDNTEEEKKQAKKAKAEVKKKAPEFGVWVGNLSYDTKSNAIKDFFKDCGLITRFKCPSGKPPKSLNKGFAYIFFATAEEQAKAMEKNEKELEGRSLLIKDAENFARADGSKAPTEAEKKEIIKQKNPPCPTLFIGNLTFEATEHDIREAFSWAGDIRKVRMATFQDSGKCKGFGYVDFYTTEAATKAIRAPDKHMLNGRKCRAEFASEEAHMRSKPWLVREKKKAAVSSTPGGTPASEFNKQRSDSEPMNEKSGSEFKRQKYDSESKREGDESGFKRPRRDEKPKKPRTDRMKPGEALHSAQRQKPTVQEFKGSKITFE